MTSHFPWVNIRELAWLDSGREDDTPDKSRLGSPSVGQANHLLSPDKTFGQAAARLSYCNACGGFGWSLPAGHLNGGDRIFPAISARAERQLHRSIAVFRPRGRQRPSVVATQAV